MAPRPVTAKKLTPYLCRRRDKDEVEERQSTWKKKVQMKIIFLIGMMTIREFPHLTGVIVTTRTRM